MNRPNIIYLHSHDTGRYVQPFGHAVSTPNLQRLAEAGVLFRQAVCAAPTCSPSRAALLTGQSAHESGMLGLAHRGFRLNDYSQHVVHTLRKAGYISALAGIQHVAKDASVIGYDRILEREGSQAEQIAAAAARFLEDAPEEPFFLDVGFNETHREFPDPGPEDDPRYTLPPASLPDSPETRRDMAGFKTAARRLDSAIGTVLEALERSGQAENTLVLYTTDHGLAFPGMKCSLTDRGIGVSIIMRGPGGFEGGKVCDALVSHVDLFPTLCELAGVERPGWLRGHSLLPLVRGEADAIREEAYAEVTFHAAFEPKRAVRTRRWKYIRNYDGRGCANLPNCDDSPSKEVWLSGGWCERVLPVEELYDLLFDPNEANDLACNPAYGDVLVEMRGRLDRWMASTDDPLLRETLPVPEGVVVNPADDASPKNPPVLWSEVQETHMAGVKNSGSGV
ncbi:MAG: sulfatase [Armatimonadetes bacterium]|nr:sulfatase [Armatimonadota bacterium]